MDKRSHRAHSQALLLQSERGKPQKKSAYTLNAHAASQPLLIHHPYILTAQPTLSGFVMYRGEFLTQPLHQFCIFCNYSRDVSPLSHCGPSMRDALPASGSSAVQSFDSPCVFSIPGWCPLLPLAQQLLTTCTWSSGQRTR